MLAVANSAWFGMAQLAFIDPLFTGPNRLSRATLASSVGHVRAFEFGKLSLEAIFDMFGVNCHQCPLGAERPMGPDSRLLSRGNGLEFSRKSIAQNAGGVRV